MAPPFVSPQLIASSLLTRRNDNSQSNRPYHPGAGTKPPEAINNKAYFALFAILGAGMVLTSIWFFFWAKNGGFVWRRGDWDDYKSTVLRRKDKDGKTLSNATPATYLGQKSVAGTFDVERDNGYMREKQQHDFARNPDDHYTSRQNKRDSARDKTRPSRRREPSDEDLRAYRHEKPARVGGLNREQDGSYYDFTSSEPSEIVSNNSRVHLQPNKNEPAKKKKGFMEKKRERNAEKQAEKKMKQERKIDKKNKNNARNKLNNAWPNHAFGAAGDDIESIPDPGLHSQHYRRTAVPTPSHDEQYASYRPPAPPHAPSRRYETAAAPAGGRPASFPRRANATVNRSRQSSPLKQSTSSSPAPSSQRRSVPGSWDAYDDNTDAVSDTGTKVYAHHIPQLRRGSRDTGFRRSAPAARRPTMGRRDSLSDSDFGDLGGRRV